MITYPDLVVKIRNEIQERINRSIRKKHNKGDHTQLSLNIYASKERKRSSIKCLKEKLRYLQGILFFRIELTTDSICFKVNLY